MKQTNSSACSASDDLLYALLSTFHSTIVMFLKRHQIFHIQTIALCHIEITFNFHELKWI